jgi:ribonucleoside-diphosphate reductase alpha chain
MCGQAYLTSPPASPPRQSAPSPVYARSNEEPFLEVIRQAPSAMPSTASTDRTNVPAEHPLQAACKIAGTRPTNLGEQAPATATPRSPCIAPTGTIAFMMDCDTTGIEPDIALVKYKKLVGGGVHQDRQPHRPGGPQAASATTRADRGDRQYIDATDTIEGAPELKPEHLPVFDCAFRRPTARAPSTTWATSA